MQLKGRLYSFVMPEPFTSIILHFQTTTMVAFWILVVILVCCQQWSEAAPPGGVSKVNVDFHQVVVPTALMNQPAAPQPVKSTVHALNAALEKAFQA